MEEQRAKWNIAKGGVGDVTKGFQESTDLNISTGALNKGGEWERAVERGIIKARLGRRSHVGSGAEGKAWLLEGHGGDYMIESGMSLDLGTHLLLLEERGYNANLAAWAGGILSNPPRRLTNNSRPSIWLTRSERRSMDRCDYLIISGYLTLDREKTNLPHDKRHNGSNSIISRSQTYIQQSVLDPFDDLKPELEAVWSVTDPVEQF